MPAPQPYPQDRRSDRYYLLDASLQNLRLAEDQAQRAHAHATRYRISKAIAAIEIEMAKES